MNSLTKVMERRGRGIPFQNVPSKEHEQYFAGPSICQCETRQKWARSCGETRMPGWGQAHSRGQEWAKEETFWSCPLQTILSRMSTFQ